MRKKNRKKAGTKTKKLRDITEYKNAENELREVNTLLKSILNSSSQVSIISTDLKGNVLFWNKGAEKMLGYKADEMIGRRKIDIVYPGDKSIKRKITKIKTGSKRMLKERNFEIKEVTKNGREIWVNLNVTRILDNKGSRIGLLGIGEDITERKTATAELEKEKKYTRAMVRTAQTIILLLDIKGKIMDFNPCMEKISGYKIKEVRGKDWFNIFLPRLDHNKIRKLFKKAVHNIQTKGNVNPIITKDGRLRYIEWYDKTMKDEQGNIIGLLATGQDITDRKKAEEKVKLQQKMLSEFSGRMMSMREKEKQKLSANLHDEVGIMAVALSSKLKLVEQDVENNNLKRALADIKNIRALLKKSVSNLKKLAMDLRPPNLDIIGLFSALEEYFTGIHKQTGVNIDFQSDGKNNLKVPVAIALYRITQEAFNNIAKHSKAKNVKVKLFSKGNNVRYQISDDGRGFEVKNIQKRNKKMGITGMNERVVSLGGNFIIKSVQGQGTALDISIPAVKRRKK